MRQFCFNRLKIPLLLLLVCVIAYLPLSSFQFALKNDAFVFNFPNKHFFSEALRSGYLPTWNPYLNFGFPIYADPGFAWWHPITWIFGLIGYNAYTFTIEVLVYIYLAGLGMYWLGRRLHLLRSTSFAIGCMFMCSGFFTGNLQHINFLTCAAFLPWLVSFWLLYQKNPNLKNLLGCSISAYLLCTGGHPAIPIAAAFFFFALTILYFVFIGQKNRLAAYSIDQLKLFGVIILFLTPLLLSYYTLAPYYSRTGAINQATTLNTGFTLPSYISFLYPFATIKNTNWFMTDVSMRNAYISIPGFLFFIIFLFNKQKNKLQYIFLIVGTLMAVLSLGGKIKEIVYEHLSVFSWINTNGEFRVFLIFSLLFCCSYELDKFLKADVIVKLKFKSLLNVLLVLSLAGSLYLLLFNGIFHLSLNEDFKIPGIKSLIDNISFKQSLLISLFITAFFSFIYLIIFSLRKASSIFIIVLICDIILSCWLLLPITGVGKTSVAKMQKILNKSPKGFPSPLKINTQERRLTVEELRLIANWSWYDKKIPHPKIDYPSQLKTTNQFYESEDTAIILKEPFVFLKNQKNDSLFLKSFTPTCLELKYNSSELDTLIILQNYFPGWTAYINGKKIPILTYAYTFIALPIEPRTEVISLSFSLFKNNNQENE